MQIIFAITTSTNNIVSCRLIKVALTAFNDSSQKRTVHFAIKEHLDRPGFQLGRDAALAKITELIKSNGITPEEMAKIKTLMEGFDVTNDEPWVAPAAS